jgi:hypothetical protein
VRLYVHYKNDSLCKKYMSNKDLAEKGAKATGIKAGSPEAIHEIGSECHMIRYKAEIISVDMRAAVLKITQRMILDKNGNHLAFQPDDPAQRKIAILADLEDDCSVIACSDIESPYVKTAISRITQMVKSQSE